jgi:hypothetical protein
MFDRHGVLMYHGEWNRKRQSEMITKVFYYIFVTTKIILIAFFCNEGSKAYVMLYSIRNFVNKVSPSDV